MTDGHDAYDQDADVVERSYDLDRKILAIPEDQIFTKRRLAWVLGLIVALLFVLVAMVFNVTRSTNESVRHEIPGLKVQIERRDHTIAQLEDVNTQAVDAILALSQQIKDLGGTPPEIVLRPSDETQETP